WIFCIALLLPWNVYADAPSPLEQRGSQPTPTPGPIDNLTDVQKAVVRIEAVGVFRDPTEGMTAGAGSGTGFIIDPEGHVVTNNHVVTGAAYLKVYVEGKEEPVNARIVGVSECADLAVIDLQGRNYPYLAWYEGPIRVGLDVYAAGFPLGDPEYTLTRGIISKARADGRRAWASVEGVIEHDANINPGNSGGPLVTTDGQVVGVNYSYSRATEQYHAIGRDGALEVIEELLEGKDVDSIGVNGQAFVTEDGKLSGIWVSSVASGSPADQVGILPGDIILSMENLPLATDGTMATYCDILRSRRANAVTAIEVLRLDTGEVLTGQLNGRPLQVSVTLGGEEEPSQSTGQTSSGQNTGEATYDEFVSVSDSQGILTFDAPSAWKDVQEGEWTFNDETVGIRLDVSPDLDNFYDDWGIPGAILRYSEVLPGQMAVEALLDEYTLHNSCTEGEREAITVGELAGAYQFWRECGGGDTVGVIVALAPSETNAYFVLLELYGVEERDFNAWDALLNSLTVAPPAVVEANEAQKAPNVKISQDSPLFDLVDVSDLSYSYVAVESPAISALLPAEYSDIVTAEWIGSQGELLGYTLTASPNIEKFNSTWTTPGVLVKSAVGMTEALDPDEMLKDETLEKSCTYDDRYTATHEAFDRTYTIVIDVYENCGGSESSYAVMMAESDPIDQVIFVDFLAVADADIEAFTTFLDSFYLDAALAGGASGEETAAASTSGAAPEPVEGPAFMEVRDDTETIGLRVPESWTDLLSEDWDLGDGPIGVAFTAAPNVKKFNDTWNTPGIFVGVSETLAEIIDDPADLLDFFDLKEDCTYDARYEYATQSLVGVYDVWENCGKVKDAILVVLTAKPVDADSPIILLYTNLPTPEDATIFGELIASLSVAGAVKSAQESAQEAVLSGATATVIVERLNVRNGPGTNYNRVGAVGNGEILMVTGQVNNCSWLQVTTPTGVEGWVSGSSQYVTLNARCADIPEAKAPAPPAGGGQSGGGQSGGANAGKGCYIFQNFIGPELTITFTNKSTGKGETFKVASNGQVEKCFDPGRYTYTLDAPPPWGSTNGELTVEAGDRFLFPITPE
ncbi:MAG: trypsin-like peptidase domain-containing protein, partial [Caldilinea sp.]|nr:trypsin-like peptidase domain-containing protein [Caldilinea sp.]MDW8440010.1 trypsin-like peptidase domain-containing protein [Caldilineaceae bacterium]